MQDTVHRLLSYSQGVLVVATSFLILFFNVEIPNELKGFVFYAQVQILCKVYLHYALNK